MDDNNKIRSDDKIMFIWEAGNYEQLNVAERVRLCELMEKKYAQKGET